MAATVPERVRKQHPRAAGMLQHWQQYGWLGPYETGTGHRFPWDDNSVQRQISWLSRLRDDAGRTLDAEDADAGFRLRAHGDVWALRSADGPWRGYGDLGPLLDAVKVSSLCTVALV